MPNIKRAVGLALVGLTLANPALASTSESEKANAFFEACFAERLELDPEFQTRLGIKDSYDRWTPRTDAHVTRVRDLYENQLERLQHTIDYSALNESVRLSYDLFTLEVETHLEGFEYRFHTYPVNQMYGLQSTTPAFLINYHKVSTVEDAMAYIARVEGVRALFDDLIVNLKARADRGIVPPQFVFGHVLSDCRNVLTGIPFTDGDDSAVYADIRAKINALPIDEPTKARLDARARAALLDYLRPAYVDLMAYCQELQQQATTDDGVWKFPNAKAFYDYRLRLITTTDLSPDEIHQLGLREVERIHSEMRSIMKAVNYDGELSDFFSFMRTDARFYYEESDAGRQAYLAEATRMIDTMRGRLPELFGIQPKAAMVVKAVEPFREKSAGKAFYQRPALDGSRPGVYYANLYQMADMPKYQMEALAYHEGIPGHHMQIAIAQELEGVPKFRKHARYTAYTEGWALYTEFIPKEIGFYQDPYSDFGRLAMELWRACRLVVDTGIHDQKWTREKAIDYLVTNTPNPRNDCVKAIERYIVMPGQATAYKIGMIKILELRESAREELGDRFSVRDFHDTVLRNGPVPLNVLEALVAEWVDSQM